MKLSPLDASLIPALEAFHQRLGDNGGPAYRFGTAVAAVPDAAQPPPVFTETMVAVDGPDVRGGIILQHHLVHTSSGDQHGVNIQLPLSEGTVDRRFAHVGVWLIRKTLERYPCAFAVGMGGLEQPLPKLLSALRWTVVPVPFLFRVHNVGRFLHNMPTLNRSAARRVVSATMARSGVGWATIRAVQVITAARYSRQKIHPSLSKSRFSAWGDWATDVWNAARSHYVIAVERDRASLSVLYPAEHSGTLCWRVQSAGETVGWFVLLRTAMAGSDYFGNLTVGTVLDCLCVPGHEAGVAKAARQALDDLEVDISLTNQLHRSWRRAFQAAGYLSAPSNYLFAASPALMRAGGDASIEHVLAATHVTRGDGDGRIHL